MTTWGELDELDGSGLDTLMAMLGAGAGSGALLLLPCRFEKTRLGARLFVGATTAKVLFDVWEGSRTNDVLTNPSFLGLVGGVVYNAAAPCSTRNKLIAVGIVAGGTALKVIPDKLRQRPPPPPRPRREITPIPVSGFAGLDDLSEFSEDPDIIPQ
jgi:hypothetical protein